MMMRGGGKGSEAADTCEQLSLRRSCSYMQVLRPSAIRQNKFRLSRLTLACARQIANWSSLSSMIIL